MQFSLPINDAWTAQESNLKNMKPETITPQNYMKKKSIFQMCYIFSQSGLLMYTSLKFPKNWARDL